MASNNVITDIESKNKATRHLNLSGLIFLFALMGLAFMFQNYVNGIVRVPYYAFNLLCGIFLMLPSRHNKGRNNLESIAVLLRKDITVYRQYVPKDDQYDGTE